MSDKKIRTMVMAAVLAALACVATMVVQIPSPMNGFVNLGDCFVLLSGWLLGPWWGAAAGGICGIVSGSTAAVIVVQLQRDFSTTSILISIGVTALISGITIGGKALGKSVAINDCTKVVYRVARIMNALHLYR